MNSLKDYSKYEEQYLGMPEMRSDWGKKCSCESIRSCGSSSSTRSNRDGDNYHYHHFYKTRKYIKYFFKYKKHFCMIG